MGDELVVEVGPGFGILTEALLARAKRVIAIEKDDRLFVSLRGRLSDRSNPALKRRPEHAARDLVLTHGDSLKIPPPQSPYLWISNITYSITSPLLDHFIRENPTNLPVRAVLLVQKEVAQKLCAKPPDMNVLALHVQTFGTPRKIATVSRGNFQPQPKVDSAIIRIDFPSVIASDLSLRGQSPKQSTFNFARYFDLIHRGFSHKRKMLRANLPPELLKKAGIDETRRAETLTIEEWLKLATCNGL